MVCYARIWNYEFVIANSIHYLKECPQKDVIQKLNNSIILQKFFRRHCVVARILRSFDYILFLDADVGVVNPKRRIEEFLDPDVDIIFYDRFYNWEIAAGGYLAKNTQWTQQFLNRFADYEVRLPPNSYHGSDNGALHVIQLRALFYFFAHHLSVESEEENIVLL
ncbi:hypothetical protein OESDEN_02401 [Oesophagostomum dentatum]|uniref:Nucleotide-diphospho-sugar transferase domain-containing protein n=1 Tax=Oesophagostomum dentatum TaxID=61180 RepID=A0A0B1TPA2_OESDE|nr:hypothetical protein OESDEN_02401 [Oesophagostomum dentatum]